MHRQVNDFMLNFNFKWQKSKIMTHIVFLDRATLPVELPNLPHPHHWTDYAQTSSSEIIPRLQQAQIAITNKVAFNQETLAALPNLKLIAVAATGVNIIDLAACRALGIQVCNVSGYSTHSVAEHTFMQILALRRNLLPQAQQVQTGEWQKSPHFSLFDYDLQDCFGSTLGIIGRGATGERVASLAAAFGMRVLFAERKQASQIRAGYTAFNSVLEQADIISLHCPLNADTQDLIHQAELASMQKHAILINNARGGIVNEAALAHALQTGRLAGAALDVLSIEPPKMGNILLNNIPNLILTPHVAWRSTAAMHKLAEQLIANIHAFLVGNAINLV